MCYIVTKKEGGDLGIMSNQRGGKRYQIVWRSGAKGALEDVFGATQRIITVQTARKLPGYLRAEGGWKILLVVKSDLPGE